MKKFTWIMLGLVVALSACKDDAPITTDNGGDDNNNGTPEPAKIELILRTWKISKATHDGVHDGSSTGKKVTFNSASSYNFDGSFDGTYRWSTDSTTLYLDEGSQFEQTWKIAELTEDAFEVDFNSPFTGKPSNWQMQPWP